MTIGMSAAGSGGGVLAAMVAMTAIAAPAIAEPPVGGRSLGGVVRDGPSMRADTEISHVYRICGSR